MKNLIVGFAILLTNTIFLNAQEQKCPRNFYDCRGACGWFVDNNNDGYCDYSAFSEALIQKLRKEKDSVAKLKEKDTFTDFSKSTGNKLKHPEIKNFEKEQNKTDCAFAHEKQNCPNKNSPVCEKHLQSISTDTASIMQPAVITPPANNYVARKYSIITIFSLCLFLYLLTKYLARYNFIRKTTHRKVWNSLLLITFFVTGMLGLLLAVQLNYQFWFSWFETLLYWHVQFGIGMAAISILHILWHWRYFKNIFRKRRNRCG